MHVLYRSWCIFVKLKEMCMETDSDIGYWHCVTSYNALSSEWCLYRWALFTFSRLEPLWTWRRQPPGEEYKAIHQIYEPLNDSPWYSHDINIILSKTAVSVNDVSSINFPRFGAKQNSRLGLEFHKKLLDKFSYCFKFRILNSFKPVLPVWCQYLVPIESGWPCYNL